MALVSLRQLLDHAAEHGYGLPAFNVNNMEQIQAILLAADDCDSPVILQAPAGVRKHAGEPFLRKRSACILQGCEGRPHGRSAKPASRPSAALDAPPRSTHATGEDGDALFELRPALVRALTVDRRD